MEEPIAKRTRRRIRDNEERENQRPWADLDRDLLLIIYHKLGIKDLILGGAPFCCSSWYKASKEPSLWREIDLNGLSSSSSIKNQAQSRKLIEFVVNRSFGCIYSIDFPLMADEDDLLFVAQRCSGLKHFSMIPGHKQMDVEKIFMAISKLSQLESISIDEDIYWSKILIIFNSTMKFLHPNCEYKLSAFEEEQYRGKILPLFKSTWKLIYQNCERQRSIREFKRSLRESKCSHCELKGMIHQLKGSIHDLNSAIWDLKVLELKLLIYEVELKHSIFKRGGPIREFEISTCELEGLVREFTGSVGEHQDLVREFKDLMNPRPDGA